MRKIVKILIIVVIISIFSIPSYAKEPDDYIEEFDKIIPEDAKYADAEELFSSIGGDALIYEILSAVRGTGGRIFSLFLLLLGSLILMSAATAYGGKFSEAAGAGVAVIVCSALLFAALPPLSEAARGMEGLAKFFSAFIPVSSGLLVSGGAVSTASASAVGMNVTVSILSGIGTPFFLSLAALALTTGTVCSFGDESLLKLSSSVKSFFMWSIGLVCATLMGAMSLQTFMASTRDSTVMRAAKYAAQSMIPIVGGVVSGAMSTLATGITYAKSIIGVGAIGVILSIFISPLIMLLLYRLTFSFSSGLAGYLGVSRAEKLFSAFRLSFDIYIAVYAVSVILYIFEIALFLGCEVGAV